MLFHLKETENRIKRAALTLSMGNHSEWYQNTFNSVISGKLRWILLKQHNGVNNCTKLEIAIQMVKRVDLIFSILK